MPASFLATAWSLKRRLAPFSLYGIPSLQPGESVMIEGQLRVRPDALALTRGTFVSGLNLDAFVSGKPQKLQERSVEIRVAQTYRHDPGAEMLLVINQETRRAEVEAWKKLASEFGIKIDIWDFSYYGFLSLTKDLEMNQGRSLLETYRGRSVVLLDNSADAGVGAATKMRDYISKQDFVSAATDYGLNFLILGDDSRELSGFISSRLLPDKVASSTPSQTQAQFLKSAIEAQKENLNSVGLWVEGINTKSRYEVEALLRKRAEQFARDLEKRAPGTRYYITYNVDPREVQINGKSRSVVGEIFMMRTLQYNQGRVIGYSVAPALSADPKYVLSDEMFRILFASMGLDQKLRVMSFRNDNWSKEKSEMLENSIIHELVDEMDAKSASLKLAAQKFPFLDAIEEPRHSRSMTGSGKQWMRILAAADFYADVKNAKWKKEYRARVAAMVSKLAGSSPKPVYTAHSKFLWDDLKKRRKVLVGFKPVVNARLMLTLPMLFRTTRSLEIIDRQKASPFAINWQKSESF